MTADKILDSIVKSHPSLLPWRTRCVSEEEKDRLVHELTVLVGSWDRVNDHRPPDCGHGTCRGNWIEFGEGRCVEPEKQGT